MKLKKTLCLALALMLCIGIFGGVAAAADPTPDFDTETVFKELKTDLNCLLHPITSPLGYPDSVHGYKANADGSVFRFSVDKNGKTEVTYVGTEAPERAPSIPYYNNAELTEILFYYDNYNKENGDWLVSLKGGVSGTGNTTPKPTETPAQTEPPAVKQDYKVSDWAKDDLATAEALGIFQPQKPNNKNSTVYVTADTTIPAIRGDFCGYIAGLFKALGKSDMLTNAFDWETYQKSDEYIEGGPRRIEHYYPTQDRVIIEPSIWMNNPFTDIAPDCLADSFPYAEEVYQLYYLGIISGVGNNQFDYYGTLTREQAATILIRAADVLGIDAPEVDIPFKDNISTWALSGVRRAYGAKLMNGYSDTNFGAKDSYTIEQAIVTTYRLYQLGIK